MTIDLPEAGAKTTGGTDAEGNAPFSVKSHATSLSGRPSLRSSIRYISHPAMTSLTDDIGFRDIRVEGTRILLNGNADLSPGRQYARGSPGSRRPRLLSK